MSDRVIDAADAWAIDLKVRRDNPTIALPAGCATAAATGTLMGAGPIHQHRATG
jgi:hypothetical protein